MDAAALVDSMLAAIEHGDAVGYAAHYAVDGVSHDPVSPPPAQGREAIAAGAAALVRAFPDLQCTVRTVLADDDRIAAEVTLAGTNDGPLATPEGGLPPTGRPASIDNVRPPRTRIRRARRDQPRLLRRRDGHGAAGPQRTKQGMIHHDHDHTA